MIGIYSFKNKINGKRYIGQSVNIKARYSKHLYLSKNPEIEGANGILYQAIRKYGIENFKFEILEETTKECLNDREKYWISYYNSFLRGYNATIGGDSGNGIAGESHYKAQFTTAEVLEIKELLKEFKLTQTEIASKYNTTSDVICLINTGINWRSVGEYSYPIREPNYRLGKSAFTDKEVMDIRKRYVKEQAESMYEEYKDRCTLSTFRGMLSGGNYKHLPIYKKRQKKWIGGDERRDYHGEQRRNKNKGNFVNESN